ncbi:MAG: serine/threonine protein kinase, partial [Anaerolineae bacterium]|nr:serine/threonine protein kinase [Anaerolineae bacterium]
MPSDPLISRTIGNYTIISRLGRGGMATVYRARQVNMQRDVALKVMSDELADDPQFIQRFEREAQFIAKLEHPRILPVHDFGHEDDVIYLVMRLIEGDSLYDRLLEGPLSLATAARYTNQIAEALDYAHMQGVIHRDLKPNNVLLDELDNVYLMDFGLAKLIASSTHLTQTGAVLGTPQYMAPEQWRGEPVDARTDIYALGVILYEMLVGRTPFESDTPYTLMYKHINDAPPPPREVQPDLPETVSEVILKALAKDRNARYSAAGELARALTTVVQAADIEGADGLVAPPLVVIPESAPEPAAEAPHPPAPSPLDGEGEKVSRAEAEAGSPAVEAAESADAEPVAQVEVAPVQAAPETGKPDVGAEKVVPPPAVPVLAVPEAIKPPPPAMILPPPALVPPK